MNADTRPGARPRTPLAAAMLFPSSWTRPRIPACRHGLNHGERADAGGFQGSTYTDTTTGHAQGQDEASARDFSEVWRSSDLTDVELSSRDLPGIDDLNEQLASAVPCAVSVMHSRSSSSQGSSSSLSTIPEHTELGLSEEKHEREDPSSPSSSHLQHEYRKVLALQKMRHELDLMQDGQNNPAQITNVSSLRFSTAFRRIPAYVLLDILEDES